MRWHLLALVLLLVPFAGEAGAAVDDGIVLEVSSDSFKLRGEKATTTFKVSNELLTNTFAVQDGFMPSAKFTDVKKGCKIEVEFENRNGDWVCTWIRVYPTEKDKAGEGSKEEKR